MKSSQGENAASRGSPATSIGPAEAVGVLGGGSWATTLAHLLGQHGHETLLWLRDESLRLEIATERRNRKYLGPDHELSPRIRPTGDLAEVAARCPLILVAIPAKALREVACALGDHVTADRVLISCTKGIEYGTSRRMSEVLREETCVKKVGALSGPNLAAEILGGHPAATVLASRFDEAIDRATEVLMGPRFRVYGSDDVVGVELAGALKNIVALGAGLVDGLGFGDNTKATLITRGLAEITRYGVRQGANPLTFAGLAGVGDLVATCGSPLSRNHQVGYRLGKGEKLEAILASMVQTAEGINTTRAIAAHARELAIDMPITQGMHRILFDGVPPLKVLAELMARPPSREIDLDAVGAPAGAGAGASA